jgi:hypothetical protein
MREERERTRRKTSGLLFQAGGKPRIRSTEEQPRDRATDLQPKEGRANRIRQPTGGPKRGEKQGRENQGIRRKVKRVAGKTGRTDGQGNSKMHTEEAGFDD